LRRTREKSIPKNFTLAEAAGAAEKAKKHIRYFLLLDWIFISAGSAGSAREISFSLFSEFG
jgi:hypothetical protein